MPGLRHRLMRPARIFLDLCLVVSLVLLWATGDITLWLHLAYIFVALSAFLSPNGWSIAVRATIVAAVAGADLVNMHSQGKASADDLLEIPLMTVLAYLVAALVVLRTRDQQRIVADRLRLAEQIDALPLATAAFDNAMRIVTWNRAAEALFGWSSAEVVGQRNPAVPEGAREATESLHRRIAAGEHLDGVEVQRQTRDGRLVDLAVFSAPVGDRASGGFLVLYEDIAERKRAERERDEAQRRYRGLVEALPIVTYIDQVDDDASNVYTSPQVVELLGWPLEEWAKEPGFFEQLLHPDDRERVMALVATHNRERTVFEAEYRIRHRDGHYVWVRDRSAVVEDAYGEAFARGFLLDITEQKRLEEQLLQAQKMDALGQFAGGIAHDFNNLLTGIGGYADLAYDGVDPSSTVARCLAGIKTAAAEAASLTSRLLAFSRRHVPERQLVDLNATVRSAVELLHHVVRDDIVVALELREPLPAVSGDPAQLKQVVLNLALNACDAMAGGGTLTFETSTRGDSIVLRVLDTGSGMDAGTRRRAMEPFFTTKPEGKGTGLGLSVVYGVVEAVGGTISIDSEPERGTAVQVILPASAETAAPTGDEQARPDRAPTYSERVLVVEDRDLVRNLARDVLEAAGFHVATAEGGPEALSLAAAGEPFDLLLTDVVMPEMSGPELATQMRARQPDLRVLFMSGYTDDVLDAKALELPGTAFLSKPFGNRELVGAVRELLDEDHPWIEDDGPDAHSASAA